MKDLQEFYKKPPSNIYVVADEDDMFLVHALIIGSNETPYENGFFYFVLRYTTFTLCLEFSLLDCMLRFPYDYPYSPPKVEIMTTNCKTVRFNPNLYANGKVCMSILGTWEGVCLHSVKYNFLFIFIVR